MSENSSDIGSAYSNKGADRFDERVDSIGKSVDLAYESIEVRITIDFDEGMLPQPSPSMGTDR